MSSTLFTHFSCLSTSSTRARPAVAPLSRSEASQTKSTPVFVNANHANERAGDPSGPRAVMTWHGRSPPQVVHLQR